MLGNDQIETLAERLLRGVTKQYSRGAVPPDDFARAVCIDDSICDLVEDSVSQLGPVFHGHALRFRSCRFARYPSAGERSALRRIWRVALQTRPRSADRTRSPVAVSQKREYFKYSPETTAFYVATRQRNEHRKTDGDESANSAGASRDRTSSKAAAIVSVCLASSSAMPSRPVWSMAGNIRMRSERPTAKNIGNGTSLLGLLA